MIAPLETPAVPYSRISDDPLHRVARYAERRAERLGYDHERVIECGRKAMSLYKLVSSMQEQERPNTERILRAVVGEHSGA